MNSKKFFEDIKFAINCNSMESMSDTPDYLLAQFISRIFEAAAILIRERDAYYEFNPGEKFRPKNSGVNSAESSPCNKEKIYTPEEYVAEAGLIRLKQDVIRHTSHIDECFKRIMVLEERLNENKKSFTSLEECYRRIIKLEKTAVEPHEPLNDVTSIRKNAISEAFHRLRELLSAYNNATLYNGDFVNIMRQVEREYGL